MAAAISICSQSSQAHLESNDKMYCLSNADPLIALLSSLDDESKSDDWRQVKYDNHLSLNCDSAGMSQTINQFGELDVSNEILTRKRFDDYRPVIEGEIDEMKQEATKICVGLEMDFVNMTWDAVDARLTSAASINLNRLTGMEPK